MTKTRFRTITIATLLIATVVSVGPVQAEPYDEAIRRFRAFAEQRVEQDTIPGLSIGFIKDDFMWADGFGWADLENRVPAKADSAYRLASVTKPMTAIAALKLVEQGKLDLDAEVQTYVPYFPKKKWPLTTRQLLGHLGGISHYRNYDLEGHFKDNKNTEEAIGVFADFELVAEPETEFTYSSYGYNLIGAVIEGASGKSYGEFLNEQLWAPLGMVDTRMDDPDAVIPNRVRGYRLSPDGKLINSEFVNISSRFAAGGTRSTVVDLLRFGKGLNEGQVLKPETIAEMLTPMATRDERYTGYGMGWNVRPRNGRFSAGHSGGQAETRTYFLWFPADRLAIAVACNFEGGDRMPYLNRLYREVMGEPMLPQVYAGGRVGQTIHAALRTAFEEGLSYVTLHGEALTDDPDQLARAFAYFNTNINAAALEADYDGVRERLGDGRHPASGRASVVVGSYVASRLRARLDEAQVAALHGQGPLPFFAAYVDGYHGGMKTPKAYRFKKPLEKRIRKWAADWTRTWNESTWDRTIAVDDPEATLKLIGWMRAGSVPVPDYWPEVERLVEDTARAGRPAEALKIAEAGRRLYPELAGPHFQAGLVKLAMDEREDGERLIRQAHAKDPRGIDAGFLNRWAYNLKSRGFLEIGLAVLEIAIDLHPGVANLYDSSGEFWLEKGDRDKAITLYEEALKLDPEIASSKAALERIRLRPTGS